MGFTPWSISWDYSGKNFPLESAVFKTPKHTKSLTKLSNIALPNKAFLFGTQITFFRLIRVDDNLALKLLREGHTKSYKVYDLKHFSILANECFCEVFSIF